ncbi:hypothetical protein DPMN_098465 [Dreissena polymorpha]|uniref:Uncharacterized protein n=1 Tax=Dreissena polymorpha TaxID=45954 RepID=A0A9D4LD23_DREPO|nr:hypothetical protein DPMN_098465 [Dreissena polymorpha]
MVLLDIRLGHSRNYDLSNRCHKCRNTILSYCCTSTRTYKGQKCLSTRSHRFRRCPLPISLDIHNKTTLLCSYSCPCSYKLAVGYCIRLYLMYISLPSTLSCRNNYSRSVDCYTCRCSSKETRRNDSRSNNSSPSSQRDYCNNKSPAC